MADITIRTVLSQEFLAHPSVKRLMGKRVVITVHEESRENAGKSAPRSLVGSVLRDDDPTAPVVQADDWEATK